MLDISGQDNATALFFLGYPLEISEHADIQQERRRIYVQNLMKIIFLSIMLEKS